MKLDIHNPESVAFMFKSKSKTLNRQQNGNMSKWLFPLLPTTTTHTPYWQPGFKARRIQKLFILDPCLSNAGCYGFLCTSLSLFVARSACAGAYFSQGIWWCYFSQLFQFRNHHLPKSSALGLFPMVWCEDPRWFQPSSSPAVTHNIYSYFVLRQANNLGGRTTELIITQGLIGMRCIAYIEINHVVIFFFVV